MSIPSSLSTAQEIPKITIVFSENSELDVPLYNKEGVCLSRFLLKLYEGDQENRSLQWKNLEALNILDLDRARIRVFFELYFGIRNTHLHTFKQIDPALSCIQLFFIANYFDFPQGEFMKTLQLIDPHFIYNGSSIFSTCMRISRIAKNLKQDPLFIQSLPSAPTLNTDSSIEKQTLQKGLSLQAISKEIDQIAHLQQKLFFSFGLSFKEWEEVNKVSTAKFLWIKLPPLARELAEGRLFSEENRFYFAQCCLMNAMKKAEIVWMVHQEESDSAEHVYLERLRNEVYHLSFLYKDEVMSYLLQAIEIYCQKQLRSIKAIKIDALKKEASYIIAKPLKWLMRLDSKSSRIVGILIQESDPTMNKILLSELVQEILEHIDLNQKKEIMEEWLLRLFEILNNESESKTKSNPSK